uniref:Max dimerization protein 3 n=1 Tax=Ornithorhynchus anatinus TaxID=9258 RepID=A0A6I8N1B4_ORNAN
PPDTQACALSPTPSCGGHGCQRNWGWGGGSKVTPQGAGPTLAEAVGPWEGRGLVGGRSRPAFVAQCQLHCNKSGAAGELAPASTGLQPPPASSGLQPPAGRSVGGGRDGDGAGLQQHPGPPAGRRVPGPAGARSVHNELEKHRRAQLRQCLEQLKQQVPVSSDCARSTTLSLLHRARLHIKKLEEQEQGACRLKAQLRSERRSLQQRLQQLRGPAERLRVDSLDSSGLSSERSDSDQEDLEVDVEGVVFGADEDLLSSGFSTGREHSYSNRGASWL